MHHISRRRLGSQASDQVCILPFVLYMFFCGESHTDIVNLDEVLRCCCKYPRRGCQDDVNARAAWHVFHAHTFQTRKASTDAMNISGFSMCTVCPHSSIARNVQFGKSSTKV